MDFSRSIYQIRNQAKLTQAQFSEIFGVSQQAVLNGRAALRSLTLKRS